MNRKLNGSLLLICFPLISSCLVLLTFLIISMYQERMKQSFYKTMKTRIIHQSLSIHLGSKIDTIPKTINCNSNLTTNDGLKIRNSTYELTVWRCEEENKWLTELKKITSK